jgi:AcrR family transcriptional regulator
MSTSKNETRLRLLDAARKLLLKRGFHGVGLEDIAEAAGVSRQAVYKSHFASKAELLLALVQHLHVAEKLDELTLRYTQAKSGLEMLEEGIRAIVLIEARIHDIAMVLTAAASADAGAAAALHDRLEVRRGALRGALERVQGEQRLSPRWSVEQAVDVLSALTSVDTYQQLVVDGAWQPEELVRRVWELAQTFLVEPGGPASSQRPAKRKP